MISKEKRLVIILCAGLGTRISDFRTDIPKVLIPIETYNDQPILGIILNTFQKYNFNQFLVIYGFLGDQIRNFISKLKTKAISITTVDASIDYRLGSLHSLLHVYDTPFILKKDQLFIIIPGDTIFQGDLIDYVSSIIEKKDEIMPMMFYKEDHINARLIASNDVNSSDRTLSVMQTYRSNTEEYVSKIEHLKINEISPHIVFKKVIPILILNMHTLSQLKGTLPNLEKKTVVTALNYLISISKLRISAVKIPFPCDFYDIDTRLDLKRVNQNK
jgi:NDP-sugar pyrophosphorylase family protein